LDNLREGFKQLGFDVNEDVITLFGVYIEKIVSTPHNLTAIRDPEGIIVRHFLDSLVVMKYFDLDYTKKFCDVGSGAGLPLMPLKIFHPGIDATFIDSRQKSVAFLDELIAALGLKKCRTIHGHTSQLKKDLDLKFDYLLVRAFGAIPKIMEECLFLLKKGGEMFLYKGPKYEEELKLIPKDLLAKTSEVKATEVHVPFLDEKRFIVRIIRS